MLHVEVLLDPLLVALHSVRTRNGQLILENKGLIVEFRFAFLSVEVLGLLKEELQGETKRSVWLLLALKAEGRRILDF